MSDTKEKYWDFIWNQPDLPEKIKSAFSVKKFDKQKILDILKKENKKTICDAGCGFGMYALYFAKYGFQVSGFDVSQKAVTAAQKYCRKTISCLTPLLFHPLQMFILKIIVLMLFFLILCWII